MQRSDTNPIYDRLTRGSHALSDRGVRWRGAAGGGVGFAIASVALIVSGAQGEITTVVLFSLALGLAALFLLAGCVLAVTITARYAADQAHALLRLSRLSPADIFAGYADGVLHRLRMLRVIGLWFPAGLIGADTLAGLPIVGAAYFGSGQDATIVLVLLVIGTLATVLVVGVGGLNFASMWRASVNLGVWIGLRWAHRALMATGVVILTGLFVSVPVIAGLILYPSMTLRLLICAGAIMATWVPLAASRVSQFAREHSIRFIDNQATLIDTVVHH